jgi:hypothetical protein
MKLRPSLTTIIERLVAIQKVLGNLLNTVTPATERYKQDDKKDWQIKAEIRFPYDVEKKREAEQKTNTNIQKVIATGGCIAATAAIVYAALAYDQIVELRRQTAQSQRQVRIDQRAWVQFEPVASSVPFSVVSGSPVEIEMRLRNIGKTAARHLNGHVVIERLNVDQPPSFKSVASQPANGVSTGILFPSEDVPNFSRQHIPKLRGTGEPEPWRRRRVDFHETKSNPRSDVGSGSFSRSSKLRRKGSPSR